MVKNHTHGSIGHVKHGRGVLLSDSRSQDVHDEPEAKKPRVEESSSTHVPKDVDATLEDISDGHVTALHQQDCLDMTGEDMEPEAWQDFAQGVASPHCRLATLNMKWMGIGPDAAESFASVLKVNMSLTNLNLERNGLGWLGGRAIGEALCTNTTLRSLDISLNDIGPEGGLAFAKALATNPSLTHLTMLRSGLGPEGGRAIGEAMQINRSLIELDITQNDLGVEGGMAFGKALASNTTLTKLNMRFNRIGFGLERSEVFAYSLATNTTLQWLDMAQNDLGPEGTLPFGDALKANNTITSLNMERNEFGAAGGQALGDALKVNDTLEYLNIDKNDMGAEGVSLLAEALKMAQCSLTSLSMAQNDIGSEGGELLGQALVHNMSLTRLDVSKNKLGPNGGTALAEGLASHLSLTFVNAARNGVGTAGGMAFAAALETNTVLLNLNLSNNDLGTEDGKALGQVLAAHPSLLEVDLSDNAITEIPINFQLELAQNLKLSVDLCNNPLSSPPLGRRANSERLRDYLLLLQSESTSVTRIRLMVLGFGGVGKTTFCSAATRTPTDMPQFQSSLMPLQLWDDAMIAAWARGLGTEWSEAAGKVLELNHVRGSDLEGLVVKEEDDFEPSQALEKLCGQTMVAAQCKKLARAIGSLIKKGYFSTVGAVKVEGLLPLPGADGLTSRECSLVDFAGQMEYLVSHQLLLASMHTLCMVIQPAISFCLPQHRHHGSWSYWLRFLRALGDRRTGSLLLAVSQLDRLAEAELGPAQEAFMGEFASLRQELGDGLGEAPVRLDYRPQEAEHSMEVVRQRLSQAAEAVAQDWWVPTSYERLAELVRRIGREKKASRELPILSRQELAGELQADSDEGLQRMRMDAQLLKRGIEYLEAVGDVMTDERLDCLLLDPVGWFASFLAYFIRDDGNPPAEVKRGVVSLDDIVGALRHEYTRPEQQVPEVMALVCKLELCVPHTEATPGSPAFLFPCLLPPVCAEELAAHWPASSGTSSDGALTGPIFRGHRFRAIAGFLPPGLFPGLVARLRRLPEDCTHSLRLWNNAVVLHFREARVLLRLDLSAATIDVVASAPCDEWFFVGAAKGQASVVVWMVHLIKQFLRAYEQIQFDEAWLCPTCLATCHGGESKKVMRVKAVEPIPFCVYTGSEFALEGKAFHATHCCEQEGCWHQLGVGHKLEPMRLRDGDEQVCRACNEEPLFTLRAGGQFGWGNRAEARQMMQGLKFVDESRKRWCQ